METVKRKCPCCNNTMELDKYLGEHKTCIICLEKSKERYQENRETILRQCKKYRDENIDKEKQRHKLYNLQNKEMINAKKRLYRYYEYYCPVCLYNIKLYRKNEHCKSVLHLKNLEYCDEQKQLCILNSRLENNIEHNNIDEEVKKMLTRILNII